MQMKLMIRRILAGLKVLLACVRGREPISTCDQCQGIFLSSVLEPTSGDWWLCGRCMDELLLEMRKDQR